MAETIVNESNDSPNGFNFARIIVNGDPYNGEVEIGTSVREAARTAARENGLVQYAVRVNNQPANLDSTLAAGDVLSIQATSTKG